MTNTESLTSYRAELEGVFRSLYHIEQLGIHPREGIKQWCDNKAGVEGSNARPTKMKAMIEPEADLLLAIHDLRSRTKYRAYSHHVYGHQDTKRRQEPSNNGTTAEAGTESATEPSERQRRPTRTTSQTP